MISDAANRLAGLASKVALQTSAVVAGTKAAVRMGAALVAAIVVTFAFALSATARAATITVNSLADRGAPGICVLRDAINSANTMTATNGCTAGDGNDTIGFSVTGTISLASTLPRVTDSLLTINGPPTPGIRIDGRGRVQVMQTASGAGVNLNQLTITNGFVLGFGGGAIRNGGTLTVTNSNFSGNHTRTSDPGSNTGCGGAIRNDGRLTVINSTFSGNAAVFDGGAICQIGEIGIVTNSTFSRNTASNGGGAITNQNELRIGGGNVIVTNSTFSGNSAAGGGGISNVFGTVTITNSTFSGNSVSFDGGGINNEGFFGATVTITNSTFSGNSARMGGGGAIIENGGRGLASIKSTTLADNLGGNCVIFEGTLTDAGYNISDDSSCGFSATGSLNNTDPQLDPAGLHKNGGPTQTIALLSGSPAIDAIPVADCTDQARPHNPIITDQRQFPRPDSMENLCDIGAYEFADTPFIPFARFGGSLIISNTRVLNLNGSFKLGRSGSIDPTTQPVAFSVGQNALRLPVGSFVQNASGYVYQKSGKSILRISIKFTNTPGSYRLLVFQQGVPRFTSPAPVTLTVGDNSGSTQMNVKFQ